MNRAETETERRIRWQCRRGLLELDILFTRFLDQHYMALDASEQASFQSLLTQPDQTLLAWIQGQQEPPSELKSILHIVIQ